METQEDIENWFFNIYDSIVPLVWEKEEILDIESNYVKCENEINNNQKKIIGLPILITNTFK